MTSLCASIDTLSMAYLDDELADEELRDFELHLIDCSACRGRVEAEREALADLRRKLAPPPTPDLVRARLSAALDAEDASTAREERRGRIGAWLLPGFSSAVAVAALAMFVFVRAPDTPADEAIAADLVQQQGRATRIAEMPRPVIEASNEVQAQTIAKVATWHSEVRGRDVVNQLFQVRRAWGERQVLRVSVFDAQGWDLEVGDRVLAEGLELWVAQVRGQYAVMHTTPGGLGLVFTSEDLRPQALIELIIQEGLIARVDR